MAEANEANEANSVDSNSGDSAADDSAAEQGESQQASDPAATESRPAAPKPLLASEALMDDLAPEEPWATACRVWTAVCGVSFALAGIAPLLGYRGGPTLLESMALAGVALLVAAAPLGYASRGSLMTLIAVAAALMGMAGSGPAAVLLPTVGFWSVLHWLAAVCLSAALMFRARYRAYAGARRILLTALAATLPFVSYCVVAISQGTPAVQIAAAVALIAIGLSSVGFMGSDTTALGAWLAGAVMLTVNALLVCEVVTWQWVDQAAPPVVWSMASLVAFAGAALLGALGVFKLLAGQHWSQARSVDLRRPPERERMESSGDTWSSR